MFAGVDDIAETKDLGDVGGAEDGGDPERGIEDAGEVFLLEVDIAEDAPFYWAVREGE